MSTTIGNPSGTGVSQSQPNERVFIRLENVTVRFGAFTAIDDLSLDIARGEMFSLLGGSGCGKTTLLRMLAGFEKPTEGRVLIDGQDMESVPPYNRPVNMMFQSYALFPHMTVEQNVEFGLKQEGLPRRERAARVDQMLEMVQMLPFKKRTPDQLSGGQSQRVALARSLAKHPKVLLLDEPLAALDKKLRHSTQLELMRIQRELGVTFIVVTHDQQEAMTLSSRMGVMNAGKIIQIGTPMEIYESPNCRFVADFIGAINVFEGNVIEHSNDQTVFRCDDDELNLRIDDPRAHYQAASYAVAIRPEKIRIAHSTITEPYNNAVGEIVDIAYFGDSAIYVVRLRSGRTVKVSRQNAERQSQPNRWIVGQSVRICWDSSSGIVLNS
jgi:putrescine transport system ATP-binding protein